MVALNEIAVTSADHPAPADRAGGSLEIVLHELEIMVAADHIPEELVVDMANAQMGDTIRRDPKAYICDIRRRKQRLHY